MSTHHKVTLKPISEVAEFMKNLIPANIPEAYALNPVFNNIASEESIRIGVIAFRDFLYLFFDRLILDGYLYATPPNKPSSMTDYPFLDGISNLLAEIGYNGVLAESGDSLLVTQISSQTASKITGSNMIKCLRFLAICGFVFSNIDLDSKNIKIFESLPLEVSYPNNPSMITGLKALSVANMELRTTRRFWNDHNLLLCDYRPIKAEPTETHDILKDYLHPLPDKVQEFALKLHQRYTNMGMTCSIRILGDINFAYADISKSKKALSPTDIYALSVWQISISMKNGYCIFVRPKKANKYTEVIEKFPLVLQEKITTGYGCDRKRGEPCQGGCQGISIPLNNSIFDIAKDIEIWIDNETPNLRRK
ncbi:MAG: hypothetical protein FWB91_05280 [Defluviitaleaceae bacterium]|nr:hypothetical protein [Defluviitaleaceae bacterium]